MNGELLGNAAAPDACQHVQAAQTKEAVESPRQFSLFLFIFLDAEGPAVCLRLLCDSSTPALPHLSVFDFLCSASETRLTGVRTSSGYRGGFRGGEEPLRIQPKAAQPRDMSLTPSVDFNAVGHFEISWVAKRRYILNIATMSGICNSASAWLNLRGT